MTVETDFTTIQSKLAKAAHAVRDARESLAAILSSYDQGATFRDIDQFTAREACTVLAALRLLQVVQYQDGRLPSEFRKLLRQSGFGVVTRLTDLEHFETEAPLSVAEIDGLCERIAVDFSR